ncbi:hypothetical protein L1F30_08050 [Simiduia sp. 21SJ11W-1]|uniref:hypothetical protein n=1 Tax=Simiduia sp. 21SJ11W-1 TaxID=2909669 RepID=UPI0020A1D7A3|nr:hypothetical protein [Simiduia sp. 21SJ11W-1]UTA49477.1 hypothetical protein L1F30_08050 [Simiduia sp. 21SJ11W-1]
MSLVPHSQLRLVRVRKALEAALAAQDWQQLRSLDIELMEALDAASDDPARHPETLLTELAVIVDLYKDVVLSNDLHRRTSGI